jgi:Asp-tRNA(Asn)/Glu-tRNA(Gln) amidotransferase A subunit family amidase
MADFKEYDRYDAAGLGELIATRKVKVEEVLEAAIERIETHNPKINAVIHKMYDAARQQMQAGLPSGPLAGVPYLLKDLTILCKGQPTSNGSNLFEGFIADHDSTLTQRLRAAGLLLLGKTNTPEFGLNAATEPIAFGSTRNPWNLERGSGGSSGGAAAAVAARMVPAAHASDGGGSIRIPASCCGVFGLKPTRARNPVGPALGEGWSGMSTGHAVSISVRDSAALLDATHGPAPGDPYCAPAPRRPFSDEVGADPGKMRIAFSAKPPVDVPVHESCQAAVQDVARLCQELGHEVEEASPEFDAKGLIDAFRIVVGSNLSHVISLRLRALKRNSVDGLIERASLQWAEFGRRASATDYVRSVQAVHVVGRRFGAFFQKYDVLLTPTVAAPPPPLRAINTMSEEVSAFWGQLFRFIPFTAQFNASGGPAMSLPLYWTTDGLPVGVQFGADFGNEALLLRLAAQLETARPWRDRRPPMVESPAATPPPAPAPAGRGSRGSRKP